MVEQCTGDEFDMLQAIAWRSQETLYGSVSQWGRQNLTTKYRRALFERGFATRGALMSIPDIEAAFTSFYGNRVLEIIGCSAPQGKASWLRSMLHPSDATVRHPLRHNLVQLFIEQLPVVRVIVDDFDNFKCPNIYAVHEDPFPVKRIQTRPRRDGLPVSSAKCSCGMWFTFSSTSESDPKLPVIQSVRRLSPTCESLIRQMHASGVPLRTIAREKGFPRHWVKKVVRSKEPTIATDQWRSFLKAQWKKAVAEAPDGNRSIARSRNRTLYAELKVVDPLWLRSIGTVKAKRKAWSAEQWHQRDQDWAQLIVEAADQLRTQEPDRPLSQAKVLNAAGLKLWLLTDLDRLPLCRQALSPGTLAGMSRTAVQRA
jgi:hypothetical protein